MERLTDYQIHLLVRKEPSLDGVRTSYERKNPQLTFDELKDISDVRANKKPYLVGLHTDYDYNGQVPVLEWASMINKKARTQ